MRFNSTLVRLQQQNQQKTQALINRFNSTLVRLQLSWAGDGKRKQDVSIPHWFDYSHWQTGKADFWGGFNSTLVRLQLRKLKRWMTHNKRFNSTLVRLQCPEKNHLATTNHVSIPHWFDYSRSVWLPFPMQDKFQFHTGSITASLCHRSTLVRLQLISKVKRTNSINTFQFHTGSITASVKFNSLIPFALVSIPHWFDYSLRF